MESIPLLSAGRRGRGCPGLTEFDSRNEILARYGSSGITDYALQNEAAQIPDDTRLTLFTVNALLSAATRKRIGAPGGTLQTAVTACYRDRLQTR